MTATVQDRPIELGTGHGGTPARRAVLRWAWRLFRREWRQQSLVLALLLVAVAATTFGLGAAVNGPSEAAQFGTADHLVVVQDETAAAQVTASFGTTDVIEHQQITVPGSANAVDLRAQDPHGAYGKPMLRLDSGRYPVGPDEIAVTAGVAQIFGLHVGGRWTAAGRPRTVVGLVENPLDLKDRFALVAPGQVATPDRITVLVRASSAEFGAFRLPADASATIRSDDSAAASVAVLLLATIGLLFAGLLAVAGFTVMAQRRLRSLGMLGALGASHRHIRLVLVANGAIVGAAGALAGAVVGLACWFALSAWLGPRIGHRIDPMNLPWPAVLAAILLAIVTAVCAAWWPARVASRVPVVAALSARPAPPRPAHRWAALGVVLLLAGLGSLAAAGPDKPVYIIGGVLGTGLGLLLFAPVGIAVLGLLARFAPLAWRLALRDLSRYRARSSAALAAIGLAVGIAAMVALGAGVTVAKAAVPAGGNLPPDQLIVWLSESGHSDAVPTMTAAQLNNAQLTAGAIGARLHATSTLPLQTVTDPQVPSFPTGKPSLKLGKARVTTVDGRTRTSYSGNDALAVFVGTPELLARFGIDPVTIEPATEILTSRTDIGDWDLFPARRRSWRPQLQQAALPATYSSEPAALMPADVVRKLDLTSVPAGWLLQAPHALTQKQIDQAEQTAAAAGLSVETRETGADIARLAADATIGGVALGLGVLAMTVGLIRSETARDLRTLTAAGARRGTRRALTAATAGALALLGAVLGVVGAYLAALAWYHREVHWLAHAPLLDLAALVIGLPILAYGGAWLLAGKEPRGQARQPID